MLNLLKSKLCCQVDQSHLNLTLEVISSKAAHEKNNSRFAVKNHESISTTLSTMALQDYSCYVFLDFNCGFISKDQDFLYLARDPQPKPTSFEKLDKSAM